MTLSTYLLYIAAVAVLILSPGPTMLMCITNAIHRGAGMAICSALGSVTAVLGVMLLSAMGLGALLAASETAFTILKIGGAAYLIYLGIKTWRSPSMGFQTTGKLGPLLVTRSNSFIQGLMVGGSNPKALLFFAAFFPQFLTPEAAWAPQFAILASTFVTMELCVLSLCALSAARLAPLLASGARIRWVNRVCGSLFATMGGVLLTVRRHA